MAAREGSELAGKYRLGRLLGEGGMGAVFCAENVLIGRPVAIKVMRQEYAQVDALVQRFLREARAANIVRHPNVVDVLDIGQDEDGTPFIVQELLEGEDLGKTVLHAGGKISLELALRYMLPIVEAVAEGHTKGVVHRDLKPDNVFLAREGRNLVPKLLDFGISHVKSFDKRLTQAGQAMGTPAYMSPEQIKGAEIDARADVWSLGVILQELVTGELPFDAATAAQLFVAIVNEAPRPLEDDGSRGRAELAVIVARCLRRDPVDRYPSAAPLLKDLRRVWRSLNVGRYSSALPSDPPPSMDPPPPSERMPDVPELVLPAKPAPRPPEPPAPEPPPEPAPKKPAPPPRAAAPAPPRRDPIELATARPPPVRVASAPRPLPRDRAAEDLENARGALAWLWLAGSVVIGATVGRLAPTEIVTSAAASLTAISTSAPTAIVVVLLALAAAASWRALNAFREGDRASGIGLGALAGVALLISVELAL